MTFAFIDVEKANHDVRRLCSTLEVSRSGYYAWKARQTSETAMNKAEEEAVLAAEIVDVYHSSRGLYGSPRVHAELRRRGRRHGRKRVARFMRAMGLQARRRRRYRRSRPEAHFPMAPNLLERRFGAATGPDQMWVGDVTYVPTHEGWLFVAVVIDLFSRRVVGWSMSPTLNGDLTVAAFKAAVSARGRAPRLFHSDRGAEYACAAFRKLLAAHGVTGSMSRTGDCWDNAVSESFHASMKREVVQLTSFSTRAEARASLFEYIEVFYNRLRLHSSLGYQSPESFEAGVAA